MTKTYIVGGAVRDTLLGLVPKDRDWVIVGATNDDVQRMLNQGYSQVGADFPVFLHPSTGDEYALARIERKTGVGYGGFTVSTENVTIEEDLARRDLTINSMAQSFEPDTYDGTFAELVDPYGGQQDLENKILRHTSAAFAEDPLRVLRLARFYARYSDFTVAEETVALCQEISESGELNNLSVERIWVELEKGFSEKRADRFMAALEFTGATRHCEILQRTFGSQINANQLELCLRLDRVPDDLRMIIGVAAISAKWSAGKWKITDDDRKPALIGAPTRLLTLYDNLHRMFEARYPSAISLYHAVKTAGAFRNGKSFDDLLLAMKVMDGDKRFTFSLEQVEAAVYIAREIKAEQFPHLTGKPLGEYIDFARTCTICQKLGILM